MYNDYTIISEQIHFNLCTIVRHIRSVVMISIDASHMPWQCPFLRSPGAAALLHRGRPTELFQYDSVI